MPQFIPLCAYPELKISDGHVLAHKLKFIKNWAWFKHISHFTIFGALAKNQHGNSVNKINMLHIPKAIIPFFLKKNKTKQFIYFPVAEK